MVPESSSKDHQLAGAEAGGGFKGNQTASAAPTAATAEPAIHLAKRLKRLGGDVGIRTMRPVAGRS